ncbi:WxL protein peptidoglycan domain-containing protein [Micromonospora craniellae]|uniref:DUF916 domain-containing protein n=1 Tax=Micromonospora craniellae TaxID=2294034 RepID=A0A372G676_9ACTN|nr:DUF916 domain-containing protein [Micromonospora craniellae]QOC90124.1 DUF916 domain-containing protein [Micromonospora craniellae]RFS48488.1 DUF916 domain-containing protein [Micromonospora craniellae]
MSAATTWRRSLTVLALAAVTCLPGPAVAAPTPTPSAPDGTTPTTEATPPASASWSVQPSSRTGPGNRPFYTYDLAPGGSVNDYVAVTNLGTNALTFQVYASDAFTTASGGFDLLSAAQTPTDVGSWVQLGQNTVTVPPRSRADIPFALQVPANATPGDHVGGIVASVSTTSADATGHSARLEQRVGTRLYLRVSGELRPSLRIDDLSATYRPGLVPFTGTLELRYVVRNTGNTRLAPGRSIDIDGLFGLPAGTAPAIELPELLPGAVVERADEVTGRPALIRLSAAVALSSEDGATARSTVGVWALSWYYLLLVVVIVAAVLLWRYRGRRTRAADE